MPRIVWTVPARADLRNIDDWLTREASPHHAVHALACIRFRASFLERFPHGGRPHGDDTRILRVFGTPYLIRYRIKTEQVEVLRIYHERENWMLEP